MLGRTWNKKLTLKVFSLHHDKPQIFITSQWQKNKSKPSIIYLFIRLAIAMFLLTTWLLSAIDYKKSNLTASFRLKYLVYLTNWGYTISTLQAQLSAIMLTTAILSTRLQEKILKIYKSYWILNTIATPVAFGITTMYWSVIYDASKMEFNEMNFFVHGSNSIVMFLDLMIVAHPVKLMHFIYPALFGIVYATFSLIYYFAGGTSREGTTYIYTILNWDKPGTTLLICLGVLLFLVILHILVWGVYKLRTLGQNNGETTETEGISETKKKYGPSEGYVNKAMGNDVV